MKIMQSIKDEIKTRIEYHGTLSVVGLSTTDGALQAAQNKQENFDYIIGMIEAQMEYAYKVGCVEGYNWHK